MTWELLYRIGCWTLIGLSPITFLTLLFVPAPYGRHRRAGFGPEMNATAGWIVQESPSVFLFALVFFLGPHRWEVAPLVLLAMWQAHYLQRTFVFPLIMRFRGTRTPWLTVGLAVGFNLINASINALAIAHRPGGYALSWLWDPRFVIGATLFAAGYIINRRSDAILRSLRAPGETGYKIPRGGLFRWVTSPNYLGEVIEWCGWALASWSLAGLAFALFTFANLAPRARAHHRWYHEKFPEYPKERRALIPGVY